MSTLKVDSIVDGGGSGAPTAPNGLTVGDISMPTTGPLSNRNLIINGAMQVAQRGTSFTTQANSAYSLDRWVNEHDAGTFDLDYLQDAGPKEHGFAYSQKVTVQTTASLTSGGYIIPYQTRLERSVTDRLQWGTSDAQPFTLSFWIKSNRTGTYTVNLNMAVPTGGSDDATARQYTVNSANTWEYKTLTFPANTTTYSGSAYNARSLTLFWWMIAGSAYTSGTIPTGWENETAANRAVGCSNSTTVGDYWQITGVQLEVGDTATPFEHRSYGAELARCQRYYYAHITAPTSEEGICTAANWNSLKAYGVVNFPTEMRSPPTLNARSASAIWKIYHNNTAATFDTLAITNTSKAGTMIFNNDNVGITQGSGSNIQSSINSANYVHFDAEL